MSTIRAGFILMAAAGIAKAQTVPRFEVASIRPCKQGDALPGGRGGGGGVRSSPGILYLSCQTVEDLIRSAYLAYADGKPWTAHGLPGLPMPPVSLRTLREPLKGEPAWAGSEKYTIDAKAESPQTVETMRGPMMQALLEDRLKLRIRRETRDVPVYVLTVAKGGPKLQPAREGSCKPLDLSQPPAPGGLPVCGMFRSGAPGEGEDTFGQTMGGLCEQFSASLDRDVIDRTGIAGAFDIHLDLSSADLCAGCGRRDSSAPETPGDPLGAISAAVQRLGLKLESAKQPGEFLVIDHLEKPGEN